GLLPRDPPLSFCPLALRAFGGNARARQHGTGLATRRAGIPDATHGGMTSMSQERDGSRGRPSWMSGVKPSHTLTEVEPLSILRLDSVVKTYRDPMTLKAFAAVDGASLTLERGEIFGVLGPYGGVQTSPTK